MTETDVPLTVSRIARGERRQDDVDRVLLALRSRDRPGSSVRDVGDFIAHRRGRRKGAVVGRTQDIFRSFRGCIVSMMTKQPPSLEQALKAGEAKLRIATEQQLRRTLSLDRDGARSAFCKGIERPRPGADLNKKQPLGGT